MIDETPDRFADQTVTDQICRPEVATQSARFAPATGRDERVQSSIKMGPTEMNEGRHGRKPGGTREKILSAALEEFSARGLSGARIERIAQHADVSLRMLYYYFSNKNGLFSAALDGALESLEKAAHAVDFEGTSPEEGVRRLTAFFWDYYRDNAKLWSLVSDKGIGSVPQLEESQRQPLVPLLRALAGFLQRGMQDGLFRDDADPLFLYAIISGLAHYAVSNRSTLEATLGINVENPDQEKRLRAMHAELVIDYLRARRPVSAH